jgi:hypothetical protein
MSPLTRHHLDASGGLLARAAGVTLLNLLSLGIVAWLEAGGHPLPVLRRQNLRAPIGCNHELARPDKGRLSRLLA